MPRPNSAPPMICFPSPHSDFAGRRCRRSLPSRASPWKHHWESPHRESADHAGTRLEIAGGRFSFDDAALPRGTTIAVADLFFNTPARRKFLRAESTELAHVTALVTNYALVHPEKQFDSSRRRTPWSLHRLSPAPRSAFTIFSARRHSPSCFRWPPRLGLLTPVCRASAVEKRPRRAHSRPRHPAAHRLLFQARAAKAQSQFHLYLHQQTTYPRPPAPARNHGVVSQRDSAHQLPGGAAVSRNVAEEVDVNVHPAKTEVRFRQQSQVHDSCETACAMR